MYSEGTMTRPLEPGQGFLVLLPSAHRYRLPPDSKSWTFFWFIAQHPYVAERVSLMRREEAAVQKWHLESPALEQAILLVEGACRGGLRDVWDFEHRLFSWLLEMERELHHGHYPQSERHHWLETARQMVRKRLPKALGASELAAMIGMERTTFSRQFRSKTGRTPAAFMAEVRLEEAMKLLHTKVKLEAIAAQTGYADANHFCKAFRRRYHTSPGIYRRLLARR